MLLENMGEEKDDILYGLITDSLKEKISLLRKGSVLVVSDYDDTFYTRRTVLEKKGFALNRGEKGNIYMLALYSGIIGFDNNEAITEETIKKVEALTDNEITQALKKYADEYYGEDSSEKQAGLINNIGDFISEVQGTANVLITAGIKELQEFKVVNTLKFDIPIVVVKTGKEKIEALINYIINTLKYIPEKIVINEDRPEYFLECGQGLANTFNTKIEVNTIEINKTNNAIVKKRDIYQPS